MGNGSGKQAPRAGGGSVAFVGDCETSADVTAMPRPPDARSGAAAEFGAGALEESESGQQHSGSASPCNAVPGLVVHENVLTETQHDKVLAWVLETLELGRDGKLVGNTYAPVPDKWKVRNQSREMLQFGVFTHSNRVEKNVEVMPMPEALKEVIELLRDKGVYHGDDGTPDSVTVNLYNPGQWIPPHIDNPQFERPIVTVSLRSTQPMTLGRGMRWPEGKDPSEVFKQSSEGSLSAKFDDSTQKREGEEAIVTLPKNSAVSLRGAAADSYEHAVPPVSNFRASLTFRKLGDLEDPETVKRIAYAEQRRGEYRVARAEFNKNQVKKGFGFVGPLGAVGRLGPLPEGVSELEQRQRARARAIAEKSEKKYKASAGATGDGLRDVPETSKSRLKKDAKKAAKLAAKARKREENPTQQNGQVNKEKETVLSADGVTSLEKSNRKRTCPACPPEMLPGGKGNMNEDAAPQKPGAMPSVEIENVQKVYDAVAAQWHGTRYRAWSGVEDFVTRCVVRGALVADVGCGNGKNAPAVLAAGATRGGAEIVGCDFSIGLLEICAIERNPPVEVFACDACTLPLRSVSFDAALCIAVLHHISSEQRRKQLAFETMRIVKVGGCALFYAWALEQETGGVSGHVFQGQDVLVPFHKRGGAVAKGSTGKDLTGKDAALKGNDEDESRDERKVEAEKNKDDDETSERVYQRYCHVYKEGELRGLFDHMSDWTRVDRVYYDCGNWCAEVTRTS